MYEEKFLEESSLGIPMHQMIGKMNGIEGFNASKESGDVWSAVNKEGKTLWYSSEERKVRRVGTKDRSDLVVGSKKVSAKQVLYKCHVLVKAVFAVL